MTKNRLKIGKLFFISLLASGAIGVVFTVFSLVSPAFLQQSFGKKINSLTAIPAELLPASMLEGQVLQAATGEAELIGNISFNIPAIFNDAVFFNGSITALGQDLDLGTGSLTASNVLYGVTAGTGVSVSPGQTPTLDVTLTAGTGISISGSTISSTISGGISSLSAGSGISVSGNEITNSDKGTSQNIFKTVAVSGQSDIVADDNNDTFTFVAGSGVILTTSASGDSLTIDTVGGSSGVSSLNGLNGALTIAGGGINSVSAGGSTITVTGTEADTLATVTGRGATTSTTVALNGGITSSSATPLSFSSTAPIVSMGNTGTLTITDGSNTLLSLADNGTSGTLTINTLAASNIGAYTLTGAITGSGSPVLSGLGTVNGATLSGGSLSGGSLTGGTYTATGLTVTGNYTATINNTGNFNISDGTNNLFTITDSGTTGNLSNIGTLSLAGDITFAATTPSIILNDGESFTITDGTNTLLTLADVGSIATLTASGDVSVNGGDLLTNQTTATLFNSTATTLSIGGAATTFNIGPTGSGASSVIISGGSADTGCTINGATGDLTCTGNIGGGSGGTVGFWSRSGSTLQPSNSGDNVTTSGNVSTTGSGTLSIAGAATFSSTLNSNTFTSTVLTFAGSDPVISGPATGSNTISINPGANGTVKLAGGAGSTGCSIDDATGDLTCSGSVSGGGSVDGFWQRASTTLSPFNTGDNVTTSGNISTSGSGTITSGGLLTGQTGLTVSGGTVSLNASSNNNTSINTGSSNGTVSIGNSGAGALTLASGATSSLAITNGAFSISTLGGSAGAINLTSALPSGNTVASAFNIKTSTNLAAADEVFQVGDSGGDFLTILGNGAIGVGNSAPTYQLDITGGTYGMRIQNNNANQYLVLDHTGNTGQIEFYAASNGGSEKLLIDPYSTFTVNHAGTDYLWVPTLTGGASDDVFISLLDAVGADKFKVRDSNAATVFSVDSDGNGSFSGDLTVLGLSASSAVYTDSGKKLTSTAPTSGTIGYWSRSGTTLTPATSTDNVGTTGKGAFGGSVSGSDYLLALTSDTAADYSRVIDIAHTNDSDEDSSVLYITATPTLGSIGGNRNIRGNYLTLTPSLTIPNNRAANIFGSDTNISLSSLTHSTSTANTIRSNTYGNSVNITGTPIFNDGTGADTTTARVWGTYSSVAITPTLTTVTDTTLDTYGGYFTNGVVSSGNANLAATSYGVYGTSGGNLTTTGATNHYAGYFSASGTADNNFGLSVTADGATNNYGIAITGPSSGSTNYALYSTAAAQSYFAGNLGLGVTAPAEKLDVGGKIAVNNGDFGSGAGIQFRNTTDTTTPTGGGIFLSNGNHLYLQTGSGNEMYFRDSSSNTLGSFISGNFNVPSGNITNTTSETAGNASSTTANSLTTGSALTLTSSATAFSSGQMLNISKTGASGSTAFTGDIAKILYSQTFNAAAGTSTGNALDISRSITVDDGTGAGISATITGALATLADNCTTGTADTCTHSANVLALTQSYTSASGAALNIANSGTGADILFNTTPILRMADGGTMTWDDGTNTLFSVVDNGTYGFIRLKDKGGAGDPANCTSGDIYFNDTDNTFKGCISTDTWSAFGAGSATTLQTAYDADANGSDSIIALTANDDSLIFRNPSSAGTDSAFTVFIDQLNTTGAVSALDITQASNAADAVNLTANSIDTENALDIAANGLTTGTALNVTSTGTITTTGELANFTANSLTTGALLRLSATAMTTGSAIEFTGPTSTGITGATSGVLSLTSDVGSAGTAGQLAYLAPDFSAGSATTGYGINIAATDSTAVGNTDIGINSLLTLTGNAAKLGTAILGKVTSSSTTAEAFTAPSTGTIGSAGLAALDATTTTTGVMTTGTRDVFGLRSQPLMTSANSGGTSNLYGLYSAPNTQSSTTGSTVNLYGAYIKPFGTLTTGGTINNYGLYVANGSSGTTGTSKKYGIYVEAPTGADNNYAAIFAGGYVGVGTTTPDTDINTVHPVMEIKNLSGTDTLRLTQDSTKNFIQLTDGSSEVGYWDGTGIQNNSTGSNGNPSFTFYGDTDTGVYHSATNNVGISAGGTLRLAVTTAGIDVTGTIEGNFADGASTTTLCAASNATTNTVIQQCNGVDYGEYTPSNGTVEQGDLLVLSDNPPLGKAFSVEQSTSDNTKIYGVYSTAGTYIGKQRDATYIPVALKGRVPVKVSLENGPIHRGDKLTNSSTAGVAMKATQTGQIVGMAMEDYDGSVQISQSVQEQEDALFRQNGQRVPAPPPGVGKILLFINASFDDPLNVLANLHFDGNGNLIINDQQNQSNNQNNNNGTEEALAALSTTVDTLSGQVQGINDSVASQSARLQALQSRVEFLESALATGSAGLNGSLLGALSYDPLASDGGHLNIDPKTTFGNDVTVLGKTTLSDLGVTGQIIAGVLTINGLDETGGATLSTLGGTLKLQATALGNLEIMNGKVVVDTSGNLHINEGKIYANDDIRGRVTLAHGQTSVQVTKPWGEEPVTVNVTPFGNVKYWVENVSTTGFTIKIDTANTQDIDFSWNALW